MLKLFGILFVVSAFFIMGLKFAKSKRARLDFLENMRPALIEYKTAIELFSVPVPKAATKSGIEKTAVKARENNALSKEDENDFAVFIRGLKAETLEGQLMNISAYDRKLEKEEAEERERYKKEAKLIKGGFALLGMLVAIMLL
ncbi:MAG: hypothetical protein Q4G23_12500 [Clostridia bacterium]|nr:hypothetical protein [Clostridia bacterium]